MKTNKLIMLLFTSLLLAACGSNEEASTEPEAVASETAVTQEDVVKTVNVNTETVKLQPFTSYIKLIGTTKAQRDFSFPSEVNGKIIRYYKEEGSSIKRGDVFARVDDEMLKKDVERLEAITASARENYLRLKELWEKDSIGTEIGYLNAKYMYEQNQASLEQIKIQLRKTKFVSPLNGVLETQYVKQGEMAIAGQPVARLIGTDNIKVEVGVPANYAGSIKKGDSAKISFDAYEGKEFDASIKLVGSSINTQSRTFKVELTMPNENNQFKIDMVANVILETERFDSTIVVAQEYVYRTENGYEVFVVGKNEKGKSIAESKSVELGPSFNNEVVISGGLSVGDQLITLGSGDVENMTRVNVISPNSTMASK